MDIKKLQIVVIEDLKDFWSNSDVRGLYSDLMQIKLDGYGSVYGENVISSDKADFFGTHLLICEKGLRLRPLLGYKSVTVDKCAGFHMKFPARTLVEADGHEECLSELDGIIQNAESKDENISFDYSWAQCVELKKDRSPETASLLRDLTMAVGVNHHNDYNIPHMLACGVVKVKTDQFFDKMGLNKISSKSLFPQKDLNGEPVHIFHSNRFSDYANTMADKYYDLWNNRLIFSNTIKNNKKIVAA